MDSYFTARPSGLYLYIFCVCETRGPLVFAYFCSVLHVVLFGVACRQCLVSPVSVRLLRPFSCGAVTTGCDTLLRYCNV